MLCYDDVVLEIKSCWCFDFDRMYKEIKEYELERNKFSLFCCVYDYRRL